METTLLRNKVNAIRKKREKCKKIFNFKLIY